VKNEMKLNEQVKQVFFSAIVALISVVLGIWLLDLPLATWIADYLVNYAPSVKSANIPDLLLVTVVILTSLSWTMYFYLAHRNIHDQRTLFCLVTGTVLPLSFGLKIILKWLFGRIETRTWLSDPSLYGFHWFNGTEGFQGFPSGHMMVFTPLFLAMWHYYPRFRLHCGAAWFCLGIALITTEYHFFSDVVAGAYIGAVIYLGVSRTVN
jgi:membrane-associated phospholipid phosphatase